MYHIKNDYRAVRSASLLYEALVTLIQRQPFEEITVSQLVREADVGRATFYRNFDRLEDVLRWRCSQTLDELQTYILRRLAMQENDGGYSLVKPLLNYFYLNSEIVEVLIAAGRTDILQMGLLSRMENARVEAMGLFDVPEECVDYSSTIRAGMAISVLVHWVNDGKKIGPDQLAEGLIRMANQLGQLNRLI